MIITTEQDRQRLLERIKLIKLDNPWRVDIEPYKRQRSKAQNALLWMWYAVIGADLGYTKDEMHDQLAFKHLEPVIREIDGQTVAVVKSTTRLNVQEFTDYLNEIEVFARDLNITLPHPEDLYNEAMGRKERACVVL